MPGTSVDPRGSDAAAAAGIRLTGREVEIRSAAIALFFRHGYAAVGVRQIVADVDLGLSTLYHYYDSKLSLLESLMDDSNVLLREASERALARAQEPRLRFAHLAAALVAMQTGSRQTSYVLDNEVRAVDRDSERGRKIIDQRRSYENLWRDLIAAGVEQGEFDPRDQDIARVSLMGMYSQISLWYRPNTIYPPADLCLRLVDQGLGLVGGRRLEPAEGKAVFEAVDFAPLPWEPAAGEPVDENFPEFVEAGVA